MFLAKSKSERDGKQTKIVNFNHNEIRVKYYVVTQAYDALANGNTMSFFNDLKYFVITTLIRMNYIAFSH